MQLNFNVNVCQTDFVSSEMDQIALQGTWQTGSKEAKEASHSKTESQTMRI